MFTKQIGKFLMPIFILMVASSCFENQDKSDLNAIFVQWSDQEGAFVDVISYLEETKEYVIAIGNTYHIVKDCGYDEIFVKVDQAPKKIPNVALSVVESEGLTKGSVLSCIANVLPKSDNDNLQEIYYEEGNFYFGTGKIGEYYQVNEGNSPCAYELVSGLFSLEARFDEINYGFFPSSSDSSKIYEISCKENGSTYDFSVGKAGAFTLVILEYLQETKLGITQKVSVPIYSIDRNSISLGSPPYNQLIADLKSKYSIKKDEPDTLGLSALKVFATKPWFDYCIETCNDGEKPKHIAKLKNNLGDIQGTQIPNLDGSAPKVLWKTEDYGNYQFVGCEKDLLQNLKISSSILNWFKDFKSQLYGQAIPESEQFVCPLIASPKVCEIVLNRPNYSVQEFNKILSGENICANEDQLKIRIDAKTTISGLGSLEITGASKFKKIVIEPFVPTDTEELDFEIKCEFDKCSNLALSMFKLYTPKKFEMRNISLTAHINQSLIAENSSIGIKLDGFSVQDQSELTLINVKMNHKDETSQIWNTGIRAYKTNKGSNLFCPSCPITPDNLPSIVTLLGVEMSTNQIAIDARNSQLFVNKSDKPSKVVSNQIGLFLSDGSQAVIVNSNLLGNTLTTINGTGELFVYNSELIFSQSIFSEPSNFFKFTGTSKVPTTSIEIFGAKIRKLPETNVAGFTFANFADDLSSRKIDIKKAEFWRENGDGELSLEMSSLPYFLTCEGNGRVLFRFKNYCL